MSVTPSAKPAVRFGSRQVVITAISVLMVVVAVVAGAMIGRIASPSTPADAVVPVTETADPGVMGGGVVSGAGGTTGAVKGMLSGSVSGSGGSGGVSAR